MFIDLDERSVPDKFGSSTGACSRTNELPLCGLACCNKTPKNFIADFSKIELEWYTSSGYPTSGHWRRREVYHIVVQKNDYSSHKREIREATTNIVCRQ